MHDERKLSLIDADHRRLVRAAARLLGPAEAEDAVQDAYVRALESDPQALNAAQAWLLTVVRNLAIDRLRRRRWMQEWSTEVEVEAGSVFAPSAEMTAAMEEAAREALHLVALHLSPEEGAAVLLHEVFEASHAEIAAASGTSEAVSRQRLRRARSRLREAGGRADAALEGGDDLVFRLCLHALQSRDPQALWAMLRQPPISAAALSHGPARPASAPATACGVMQLGGQLGLVLTLDGVTLCVLPLGVSQTCQAEAWMV